MVREAERAEPAKGIIEIRKKRVHLANFRSLVVEV